MIGRVLTILILALSTAASAALAVDLEAKTRAEDLAAASAFKSAAQKIALLTLKKEGAHDELPLMVRLMETLNRVGAVQFRLVHSATNDKDTLLASTDYHVTLSQIVGVANRFLKKFPSSQEVARVMFLRAKSYRDLGQDADAVRDFRALIDRYPDNEDLANAEFTLYELLIKAKDYRTAIAYLKRFQALPTEDYYPLYLDHLAFAHYFVNEIPEALRYLEQELARFTEPTQREKVLQNSVLFYFTGIENHHGTLGEGIAYLKKLNPGAATGKLLVYYGNLLRSKGHDDQIDELKRIVLASDFMPADDCELLFNVFENELNKGRFAQLRETADELNHWIDKAGGARRERTQKLLADAASHLQEIFSKTRSPAESARVSPTLTSLYELMLKTTTGAAALQKIRFNLAELRFALKDYDGATTHYRWIAENGPRDPANAAFVEQAALKAIGARYESLSLRHVFPKELAPRALPGTPSSAIPPQAAEWVSWVAAFPQEKQWAAIEVFVFEADRFLYSQGHLEEALANLKALMHAHPTSKFAVPAASLVLDTEVASEHWSEANTYATELLGSVEPGKTEFRARLLEIASDSYFKILGILYKAGQYAEVLVKAETFLKTYPTSPRKTECLALAASSSLATHDKKRALAYFSPILNDQKGQPEVFGTALLTRASVAEERYDFESASADYRRYLNLPAGQRRLDPKELEQLKGKTLLLSWLSGSSTSLRESLAHPVICPRAGNLNCEKFTALLALAVPADPKALKMNQARALKDRSLNRILYLTLALRQPQLLTMNERFRLVSEVGAPWEQADSLVKFRLIPMLSASVVESLRLAVPEIRAQSKLKLDKKEIQRRVHLIETAETAIQKAIELPWTAIRAGAYTQWANLYLQFSEDIAHLPRPKGLAKEDLAAYEGTIEELRAPIQKKAEELGRLAAESTLKARPGSVPSADFLTTLGAPAEFVAQFKGATGALNWQKLVFLIEDAREKKTLSDTQQSAAIAISLAYAGAGAEGHSELERLLPKLDFRSRSVAMAFFPAPTRLPAAGGTPGARP